MESISSSALALIAFAFLLQNQSETSTQPRFLEQIHVVSVHVSEGVVSFTAPGGELRSLREGDFLEEEGGAKLTDVTSSSLVFILPVKGGNGEDGKARIVVRYDGAGKTKVREYRSVGDVSQPRPPR